MMRTHRPGFTLIELMIVVLVVAILARIAIPAYQRYIYLARAAAVLSDIHSVRLAAYAYQSDNHVWPPDVSRGIVPPGLRPYLGEGFTFTRDTYLLDWDNWMLPDGSPQHPGTGVLVGVSLTTTDERFGAALVELLGEGTAKATIGEHYTFVVVAAD